MPITDLRTVMQTAVAVPIADLHKNRTSMGTIAMAQASIAVLRARFALHPSLRNLAGSQPPKMLPTEAAL